MTPPISIDGSSVEQVRIDGEFVNQATIDGEKVYLGEPAQPAIAYGTYDQNIIVRDTDMNLQASLGVPSHDVNGGCVFSPNGKYLASGDDGGNVYIHEINTNPGEYADFDHIETFSHWPDEVWGVSFSPNGNWLLWAGEGNNSAYPGDDAGQVAVYETPDHPHNSGGFEKDRIKKYTTDGFLRSGLGWSPDSNYVAHGGYDGSVTIYGVSEYGISEDEELHRFEQNKRCESDFAWSNDGNYFAYARSNFDTDNVVLTVRENDGSNWPVVHENSTAGYRCRCGPAFSPDSSYLAMGDRTGHIYIYDVPGFNLQEKFRIGYPRNSVHLDNGLVFTRMCQFTPDGNYLGVMSIRGAIEVFSVPRFNKVTTVGEDKHDEYYQGMYTDSEWHPANGPFNF